MTHGPVRRFVKRHPLVTFFVLAYALSWWPAIPSLDLWPEPVIGVGPFLAAVAVLALTSGKAGVTDLLRRMVRWRVGVRWWAVALLLPVAAAGTATALNVLLGAEAPSAAELGDWPNVVPIFLVVLLVPGLGGAWEEPGFRGYALPRLAERRSPLAAALLLSIFWVGWHLPLFLTGGIEWPDVALIPAASVVFAWVVTNARGSVLIVMVLHAMNNAVSGNFFSQMFGGDDAVRQSALLAVVWIVVAAVVVVVAGSAFRSRPAQTAPEPAAAPPALGPAGAA